MEGLEKLRDGRPLTPQELYGLEAVILPDKRPVVFIRDGVFDEFQMHIWQHLNGEEYRTRLEPLFPSIGRVELPEDSRFPYAGTAFVVGDGLLMTNRHIARIFTDGLGTRLKYHAGGSAIDFKREQPKAAAAAPAVDARALLEVRDVAMIHPYWDMALLVVKDLPASAKKLSLSVEAPEGLLNREIVVVGYPFFDVRNPKDVQDRVFEKTYGVKRMQPGKVKHRAEILSFENRVNAMTTTTFSEWMTAPRTTLTP